MAAMYYKNNSEGAATIDPHEHLYIIPDQTTVSSTSTTKRSLTTGNNSPPRNSSNTCRIFLIIIASLIIGCAVGCVVMYLWTQQIGSNETQLEVTGVFQDSAEDSTEKIPATVSQCACPTCHMAPAFPTRVYTFYTAAYPLGIEDGYITNQQITASSSKSPTHAAHKARINVNNNYHWVNTDPTPWIQVAFSSNVTIRGIQTQGNKGSRWVKTLQMQTGDSEQTLSYIRDGNTNATFTANSDSSTVATVILPEPIYTSYLRIHPITWNWDAVGLRIEVLGSTD